MMKTLIVSAVLAVSMNVSAGTSDEWTLEQWASWCGDSWEEVAEQQMETPDTYYTRAAANGQAYIDQMNKTRALNDINSNMMWSDDTEFQQYNGQ